MLESNNTEIYKNAIITTRMHKIIKEFVQICRTRRDEHIYFLIGDHESGKTFLLMIIYESILKNECHKLFLDGKYIKTPLDFYINYLKNLIQDKDFDSALLDGKVADKLIKENEKYKGFKKFFEIIHGVSLDPEANPKADFDYYSNFVIDYSKKLINEDKKIIWIFIDEFYEMTENFRDPKFNDCKKIFLYDFLSKLSDNKFLVLCTTASSIDKDFKEALNKNNIKSRNIDAICEDDLKIYLTSKIKESTSLNISDEIIEKIVNKIGLRPYYAKILMECILNTYYPQSDSYENIKNKEKKEILTLEILNSAYNKMLINLTSFFKLLIPDSIDYKKVLDAIIENNGSGKHYQIASLSSIKAIYLGTILKRLKDDNLIDYAKDKGKIVRGSYIIKDKVLSDWLTILNKKKEINLIPEE